MISLSCNVVVVRHADSAPRLLRVLQDLSCATKDTLPSAEALTMAQKEAAQVEARMQRVVDAAHAEVRTPHSNALFC